MHLGVAGPLRYCRGMSQVKKEPSDGPGVVSKILPGVLNTVQRLARMLHSLIPFVVIKKNE